MLKDSFLRVYGQFKMQFFRSIFSVVREREGSLTAMEAFSVEAIHGLAEPTVGEFAEFLGISQSNATYKVNSLIRKGYLERQASGDDRRAYHLVLSDKYYAYTAANDRYLASLSALIARRFPAEDVEKLSAMLDVIAEELMPRAGEESSPAPGAAARP